MQGEENAKLWALTIRRFVRHNVISFEYFEFRTWRGINSVACTSLLFPVGSVAEGECNEIEWDRLT